ncbi:PKD domain-containing protein [Geodermatophilus sp. URMC 64]
MPARASSAARRAVAGLLGLLLLVGGAQLAVPAAALADSAPLDPTSTTTPATVSADGLPTVQIDGVVWSQVTVGNTVYVAGSFAHARPAGAALGTNETVRDNLLAYDIRTGALIPGWAPSVNAQARAIKASPDGTRIYVGGDFTQANGVTRNRLAAFDATSGALITSFAPSVNGTVRALATTNTSVYFGGAFSAVGKVSRTRVAAVNATTGALLSWAPVPGNGPVKGANEVLALAVTSNNTQVVIGGRFYYLNGGKNTGVGAVNATTGAVQPFAVNKTITNNGVDAAVFSLHSDGTTVYGTTYHYGGTGNFEGPWIATAAGGTPRWFADCRGDSYSSFPMAGVLYVSSHAHNCGNMGGFPEQTVRVHKFGVAYTLAATGRNGTATFGGSLVANKPAPTMLPWWPTMTPGEYTGQFQAGFSVTGNGQYLSYGGEFPRVNGVGQQGLVRYALPTIAPNKIGPEATLAPTASALGAGAVRIRWTATSDADNENLTYRLYRDGNTTTPIYESVRASQWWKRPVIAVADTGLPAGAHSYRVTASDPFGNTVSSAWIDVSVTTGSAARPYADAVRADGPMGYWTLGERSGNAIDHGGISDMTLAGGAARGVAGALGAGDADTAFSFNGSATAYAATQTAVAGPQVFSEEAWFQTTSTAGGRIVGFGDAKTGFSTNYERHIYMDTAGRVLFGVHPGAARTVASTQRYNDGRWHHVVATLGPDGMVLYVDGRVVGSRTDTKAAQAYNGYWRVGADGNWGGAWTFSGRIDEVAVYPSVLSAAQVANHYAVATTGQPINLPPTAAFTSSVDHLDATFGAGRSTDRDGTIASYAWNFGDGTTGTGPAPAHAYSRAGTWTVTLTVTDDDGATATRTASVTTTEPPPNVLPTAAFDATATGRTVVLDAARSTDADGTVVSHAWTFGDGGTGSGRTASHTYAADGDYTVVLTVTDDDGDSSTVSQTLHVSGAVLAADAFQRIVAGGLGIADAGGTWTVSAGGARQSVSAGSAVFAMTPGTNTGSYLGAVSRTDVDMTASLSSTQTPSGSGTYVYLVGRRVGANQEYRARVRLLADGSIGVAVTRLAGSSSETQLGTNVILPEGYTTDEVLNVRFVVRGTGTTELAVTVWPAGTPEPATPTVTRTDTTASLQAPGSVGLLGYLSGSAASGVTLRFDDLVVVPAD